MCKGKRRHDRDNEQIKEAEAAKLHQLRSSHPQQTAGRGFFNILSRIIWVVVVVGYECSEN